MRYEPGFTVGNQPARGGQSNYTIRGIGENRVLVLQDGLRIQDFPGTYTRDFTDLDGVKRVEIVRGQAGVLYGSDALGGVINYILKDPADRIVLSRGGRILNTGPPATALTGATLSACFGIAVETIMRADGSAVFVAE